ncbi:PD-(D/E)XK nuclease family protein [Acidaminobacterium chupaoyuni]
MLTIYHGRAQCGKTQALFEEIRRGAEAGRKQILVVPEMLSHETERRLLKECGNPISRYAEVLTFQRMAARILKEAGETPRFLDAGGRVLTMYRALRNSESGLCYFKTAGMRPELVEKLAGIIDELKACCVSPEQLMQAAENLGVTKEKVSDLSLIYAAYERLCENAALDDKELLSVAEEALGKCDFGHEWDFYFDGFMGMTVQERRLLKALLLRCHDMSAAILWQDELVFNEQKKLILRLKAIAEELGEEEKTVALEREKRPELPELDHLEKELLGYQNNPLDCECKAIKLSMLDSPAEECEYAAAQVRKAVAEEGLRYREIVLAAGNIDEYGPLLEQAFARYEAPLFLAQKSDILAKPVLAAALGAVEAVSQGMRYEAVMRYLRAGLSPLESGEADLLENYLLTWDIKGEEYEHPFVKNPYGFDLSKQAQGEELLPQIEAARQKLIAPLQKLKQRLENCSRGGDYARALTGFFEESLLKEKILQKAERLKRSERLREEAEYRQLWQILENGLRQFETVMEDAAMDCDEFLRLWRLMLAQYHVGTIPVGLDCVQAGSLERLSFHHAKLVILIGARDGNFPAIGLGGTLLTEQDRAELKQAGVELTQTAEEHAYEAQSHAYRVVASAPRLLVACPQRCMDGSPARPSYLVLRMQKLLPQLKAEYPAKDYYLYAKAPSFELACTAVSGENTVEAQTALQLAVEDGMEDRLERFHRFAALPRGPLKEEELIRRLYGSKVRMTASRAEKIAGCRFSYFMEYGLKARPRKRARFGAPETGTFLHYVVENTIRELCLDPQKDRKTVAEEYMDRYIREELEGLRGQSKRLTAIFARLRRMVLAIIDDVWEELQRSAFRPIRFEMGFGEGEENPAVVIENGEAQILLGGKIDRLDGYIEGDTLYLKVVDYKTGRKEFRLSDVLGGINLQMFLYLIMLQNSKEALLSQAREALGKTARKVQTAGVLYVPAKHPYIMADPEEDEKDLAEKQAKEVRRIGIVLDEPEILEKLEKAEAGNLRFLPISYKKNGGLSSTSQAISAGQFEKLVRGVQRQMQKIAAEIAKGEIEANPYCTGPQWSVCQWCDFKAACQFDETMEKDSMRRMGSLKNSEVFARLDQEEESEHERG